MLMIPRTNDTAILTALVSGANQEGAAKLAGVSTKTVQRRLTEPDFLEELENIKRAILHEIGAELSESALEGVRTLTSLLGSDDDRIRFKAACRLVELNVDHMRETSLDRRLVAVETALRRGGFGGTQNDR
jgi:hypothetical protein